MAAALTHGEQARWIPIERLRTLKDELHAFRDAEPLNGFQRWILSELFTLDVPPSDFPVRSILLVAIPRPPWAEVELRLQGRRVRCQSLVFPDFEEKTAGLGRRLTSLGWNVLPAPNVPLKRLAARSGLAVYGRNNICYVEGMGSHFSLTAYFTDRPCEDAGWAELALPAACERCAACLHRCPTGALRKERFLIDNERCLSFLNEQPAEFPEWLPASAHHSLYDCLRCQDRCPLNRDLNERAAGPIELDEREIEALLSAVPFEQHPPALREKAELLGMLPWSPQAIARNIRALLDGAQAA